MQSKYLKLGLFGNFSGLNMNQYGDSTILFCHYKSIFRRCRACWPHFSKCSKFLDLFWKIWKILEVIIFKVEGKFFDAGRGVFGYKWSKGGQVDLPYVLKILAWPTPEKIHFFPIFQPGVNICPKKSKLLKVDVEEFWNNCPVCLQDFLKLYIGLYSHFLMMEMSIINH